MPADVLVQCRPALVAGLLTHALYFIHGFRGSQPLQIILAHAGAILILAARNIARLGPAAGALATAAAAGSYCSALLVSIAVYRLCFHRIRHFPGPRLDALSKTVAGPLRNRAGRAHVAYLDLHARYGDWVRTGPAEISVVSPDAIAKVHGTQTRCTKENTGLYDAMRFRAEPTVDSIIDSAQHRDRRRLWDRALSSKALEAYEPAARAVVQAWLARLRGLDDGQAVNTTLLLSLLSFDHMGRVGYSKDFGTVSAGRPNRMLDMLGAVFRKMAQLGSLGWAFTLVTQLPSFGLMREFEDLSVRMVEERLARDSKDTVDMMDIFVEDYHSESPRSFTNFDSLVADTEGILVAATDTVASALGFLFYELARSPSVRSAVVREIAPALGKTIPAEFCNADLSAIPFLDAVINESLRLHPTVTMAGPRITPPEGIEIDRVWVPGDITVVLPVVCYHQSEKFWVRPLEYIPERWTTQPELILDRRAFWPFNVGRRDCPGKRLAYQIMRLTVAYTVWNFDFEMAPHEDGSRVVGDAEYSIILNPGSLDCVFRARE